MKKDCNELRNCCLYVRKWIVQQPSVKEESITDWLLFNISDKISRITYKAFTRNEEASDTGADWEWWFIFNKFSYKMRVQAKKIKINDDNYSLIAYTNKYGMQIEKLIQKSISENFIPLYAFYTSVIDQVKCGENIINEGVYMVGGNSIYDNFILPGKKKIVYNDILKETTPLSCFLCCPLCVRTMDGYGFQQFLSQYFYYEIEKNKNNNQTDFHLGQYKKAPNYIQSFIRKEEEGIPKWWEKEFQNQIQDINALVVYDARNNE